MGWVAVGVNEFTGVVDAPSFDPLRNREPAGRVGKSILLFRLAPEEIFNLARLQGQWPPREDRALGRGVSDHPRNSRRLGERAMLKSFPKLEGTDRPMAAD